MRFRYRSIPDYACAPARLRLLCLPYTGTLHQSSTGNAEPQLGISANSAEPCQQIKLVCVSYQNVTIRDLTPFFANSILGHCLHGRACLKRVVCHDSA